MVIHIEPLQGFIGYLTPTECDAPQSLAGIEYE